MHIGKYRAPLQVLVNEANSDSSSSVNLRHTYPLHKEHWIPDCISPISLYVMKLPNNSIANISLQTDCLTSCALYRVYEQLQIFLLQ